MEILNTDIERLQLLFRARFGIELDRDSAHDKLSKLVKQMETIYQPVTKAQLDNLTDRKGEHNEQGASKAN